MRKKIDSQINRYLFSDELPLEHKIFNLVLIFGIIAEIAALLVRIIEGVSLTAIFAVAGMITITSAAFFLCTRFKLYKWGIPIALIFICDILFPVIYFTNGGISSGLAGYFVLCIILIFILLRGTFCLVMTIIHIAIMAGCYITEYFYPSLVIPFQHEYARYIDIIHTILIAGFLSGFLIKFQIRIYEREKNKAEAATRAKADFLANVSHEIRTPLNAIIGLGELELRKKLPDDTLVNLDKIHNSGMSLLSIINDLLDISKIDSGRFELILFEYQTASFINDTATLNMVRIGSKPINFQLDIDENLPQTLYGDELRLKQILNNLLSNAFKYTREGSVWLKIRCEPIAGNNSDKQTASGENSSEITEDRKANLVCTIKDTGIGIKEEDIGKLFSEYNQLDTRTNRHIEGTGLGLSITKNLVILMGGTINVTSEYGKGTAFTVTIPQDIVDPAPIGGDLAEKLAKFRFYATKRSRKRIILNPMPYAAVLVVDDVSTNLDVARGMMLPYGLTIDVAYSGREAIKLVREERMKYDAIFMDHMMPEMDGIEAVRIIRNEIDSDYARTVPIIALTANAIIGNEKMFIGNGFQDYLSKPIDMAILDVALQRWVRNREKEASAEWAPEIERIRQEQHMDDAAVEEKSREKEKKSPLPQADKSETSPKKSSMMKAETASESPIEGVDFAAGIKRMGNKEAVFIRILSSFAAGMPSLLNNIRHFDLTKIQDYIIIVHGIKGSCYGICANELGRQAEALEMAAKSGDVETVLAKNDGFILHMEKLVRDISKFVTSL